MNRFESKIFARIALDSYFESESYFPTIIQIYEKYSHLICNEKLIELMFSLLYNDIINAKEKRIYFISYF